jgi:hypothetical protein
MAGMARAVLRRQRLAIPAKAGYDLSLPYHDERRYNLASKAAGALMPGDTAPPLKKAGYHGS